MADDNSHVDPTQGNIPSFIAQQIAASQPQQQPTPDPNIAAVGSTQLPPDIATNIASGKEMAARQQAVQQNAIQQAMANRQPSPGVPNIASLVGSLFGKDFNTPKDIQHMAGYQPPSKTEAFEGFLTNFMQAFSAGMAGEGKGPGAATRGFGIAAQQPYQQALQNYQLGLQSRSLQSQEELRKAQEEFNRQRSLEYSTVTVPQLGSDGQPMKDSSGNTMMIQLPAKEAGPYLSRIGAAGVTGAAGIEKTKITAQNRLDVEAMKVKVMQGQATRFIPDVDQNGQRFYRLYNKFGKEVGQADVNVIPQLMDKVTKTMDIKQQEDGSYISIPKTTTVGPVIPNRASLSGGVGVSATGTPGRKAGGQYWGTSAQSGAGGGVRAVPILGRDGLPLFGKAPENIRTMSYTAGATLPHFPDILDEMNQLEKLGVLGEFAGKATDFLTKKGFTIPGLTAEQSQLLGKFANDVKLMDSAMLRTHFGARGGQGMYDKFSDMLNAGEHPDLMRGGLESFRDYLVGYKDMMTMQTRESRSGVTPPLNSPNKPNKPVADDGVGFVKLGK